MIKYKDLDGDSSIQEYEIGADYIDVLFRDRALYRYSYASAGKVNIENAKNLALRGNGLNSYIMRNMKFKYETKTKL